MTCEQSYMIIIIKHDSLLMKIYETGATKGTLRRENENSFFGVLCLITSSGHFKIKISFLVQFLTKLWLLQCLETRYQKK